MKKHRFDPISFVFGLVFVAIAAVFALLGHDFDLEVRVLPISFLILGIGLLIVTLRGLRTGNSDDAGSVDQ